jgi:hypothetical protein
VIWGENCNSILIIYLISGLLFNISENLLGGPLKIGRLRLTADVIITFFALLHVTRLITCSWCPLSSWVLASYKHAFFGRTSYYDNHLWLLPFLLHVIAPDRLSSIILDQYILCHNHNQLQFQLKCHRTNPLTRTTLSNSLKSAQILFW